MRPEEAEEMDAMGDKIASLQCRLARAQKEREAATQALEATRAELENERRAHRAHEAGQAILIRRVSELETALLDACREKVLHGHTTTLLSVSKRLGVPGIQELCLDADQLRAEEATRLSEVERERGELQARAEEMSAKYYASFAAVERELDAARASVAELVAALEAVLASAHPHPVEHPAMTRAWKLAAPVLEKAKGGRR
jgi:hypothetical protein